MEDIIRLLHDLPKILERISQLEEELAELKKEKPSGQGKLIPLTEVQEILKDKLGRKPSRNTLNRWHVKKKLIQIGGGGGDKIYYRESDVYNMQRTA
jgi:hypothetical protein